MFGDSPLIADDIEDIDRHQEKARIFGNPGPPLETPNTDVLDDLNDDVRGDVEAAEDERNEENSELKN